MTCVSHFWTLAAAVGRWVLRAAPAAAGPHVAYITIYIMRDHDDDDDDEPLPPSFEVISFGGDEERGDPRAIAAGTAYFNKLGKCDIPSRNPFSRAMRAACVSAFRSPERWVGREKAASNLSYLMGYLARRRARGGNGGGLIPRGCRDHFFAPDGVTRLYLRGAVVANPSVGVMRFATYTAYDDVVSRHVLSVGFFEIRSPDDIAPGLVSSRRGGTFIDIGANIGYYSMLFLHARFRVYSIEPFGGNLRALRASLCLTEAASTSRAVGARRAANISVIPAAIGPAGSLCRISVQTKNRGNARMTCMPKHSNTTRRRRVRLSCDHAPRLYNGTFASCEMLEQRPLDDILAVVPSSTPRPVVAKMDLEGGECGALETGLSLFSRLKVRVPHAKPFRPLTLTVASPLVLMPHPCVCPPARAPLPPAQVDYLQIENKLGKTQRCLKKLLEQLGNYHVGPSVGLDNNTVLSRISTR